MNTTPNPRTHRLEAMKVYSIGDAMLGWREHRWPELHGVPRVGDDILRLVADWNEDGKLDEATDGWRWHYRLVEREPQTLSRILERTEDGGETWEKLRSIDPMEYVRDFVETLNKQAAGFGRPERYRVREP